MGDVSVRRWGRGDPVKIHMGISQYAILLSIQRSVVIINLLICDILQRLRLMSRYK